MVDMDNRPPKKLLNLCVDPIPQLDPDHFSTFHNTRTFYDIFYFAAAALSPSRTQFN